MGPAPVTLLCVLPRASKLLYIVHRANEYGIAYETVVPAVAEDAPGDATPKTEPALALTALGRDGPASEPTSSAASTVPDEPDTEGAGDIDGAPPGLRLRKERANLGP